MNIKSIISAALIACVSPLFAQVEGVVDDFNEDFWEENPTLTKLTDEEKKSNAVYLANVNVCSYEYGPYVDPNTGQTYDEIFLEENLYYKRIRLNNDKAVETFNRVYISMANGREITNLKARAISKDGKVIEFDDSNQKEVENYE